MATDLQEKQKERAKLGEESLAKSRAQGKPGEKQPAYEDNRVAIEDAIKQVDETLDTLKADTKKSSAERSKESGNPNPVPPEERTLEDTTQSLSGVNAAAGHLSAARTAMTTQNETDALLRSDPRYERDLKVQELALAGKLGAVPQPGVMTTEQQAEDDMKRLEAAEQSPNPNVTMKPKDMTQEDEETARLDKQAKEANLIPPIDKAGQVRPGTSEYKSPVVSTPTKEADKPNEPNKIT